MDLGYKYTHAIIFGNDAITSLGHTFWKLIPGKMKNLWTLSLVKSKIKSWTTDHSPNIFCKVFIEDLGIIETCLGP